MNVGISIGVMLPTIGAVVALFPSDEHLRGAGEPDTTIAPSRRTDGRTTLC